MQDLEAVKKAEEYGYITHDEAATLVKKALGVPEPVVVETPVEPVVEVPAEAPVEPAA